MGTKKIKVIAFFTLGQRGTHKHNNFLLCLSFWVPFCPHKEAARLQPEHGHYHSTVGATQFQGPGFLLTLIQFPLPRTKRFPGSNELCAFAHCKTIVNQVHPGKCCLCANALCSRHTHSLSLQLPLFEIPLFPHKLTKIKECPEQ